MSNFIRELESIEKKLVETENTFTDFRNLRHRWRENQWVAKYIGIK